jgi:peptide-methionine (R)-S-oxide reductase
MKIDRRTAVGGAAGVGVLATVAALWRGNGAAEAKASPGGFEIELSDAEWKARLSPAAYRVLRHEGTERAGSSPLNQEKREGIYACAGCDLPLYPSKTKYESGTGWPSFYAPLPDAIGTKEDDTFFTRRTEVHCRRCGGHLGHVFDDGPPPTGLRYCMNGDAMKFVAA